MRTIWFEDEAAAAGLVFEHRSGVARDKRYIIESIGAGTAVADFNGDGHLDVFLCGGGKTPRPEAEGRDSALFFGDGKGRFTRSTQVFATDRDGVAFGAVAADYDRDGDMDLFVCRWGENILWRNEGNGDFVDVTAKAGLRDRGWSSSAAFGDVDGDGWLDLYVAKYLDFGSPQSLARTNCDWAAIKVACGPKGEVPEADRLYRNKGDGTFEDVSDAAGITKEAPRYALAVMMTDIDRDRDLDIYVANDSMSNALWINDGKGHFTDSALEFGLALSAEGVAQASMGIAIDDMTGDDRPEVVVTNFARDYDTVYVQQADGTFDDRTDRFGMAQATWRQLAFGIISEDFDRDGRLDLFVANGHVYPEVDQHPVDTSYFQRCQIFRNDGGQRFIDVSDASGPGLAISTVHRGAAAGDFDEDGRIDLVVNVLDGKAELLMNRSERLGHWVAVRVRGRPGVSDLTCVGARVAVESGGRTLTREIRAGGSFASCSGSDVFFGLGSARIDSIVVSFPDGRVIKRHDAGADQVVLFERGGP